MIEKFTYLQDSSGAKFIKDMMHINDSMLEALMAINDGKFNGESDVFTLDKLTTYICSLVSGQRGLLGRTVQGSWGIAPNDDGMDSDAIVEFIFKPTYIATATLTRFLMEYPSASVCDDNYKKVLRNGMIFCTHRNLRGHGYECEKGMIEAFTILALGKVPLFLLKNPDFCPELKKVIDNTANEMTSRLEQDTAKGAWGEDYSDGFRAALERLYLLNNDSLT